MLLKSMEVNQFLQRYSAGERVFAKINLREAELVKVNLSKVDLTAADLRQSPLGSTNFSHACLREADLSESILWGADLTIADLKQVILREADYGYATVVEILSAALQQGAFMKQLSGFNGSGDLEEICFADRLPYSLGHFFMAIDIAAFTEVKSFKKITGDILRSLPHSQKVPGAERIYTCGEKEHLAWLKRKDTGIPINEALQKDIIAMGDELGLMQYRFDSQI